MKYFTLVVGLLFAGQSFAAVTPTIKNYRELSEFLSILSDVATNGASLEHFSFRELNEVERIPVSECKPVSQKEIAREFAAMADQVWEAGYGEDFAEARNARGDWITVLRQFNELISVGEFVRCTKQESVAYSLTSITQFQSTDYVFEWELGWED